MGITFALSVFILFLSLFFIFSRYVVDGQIILPWLIDEMPVVEESPPGGSPDEEPSDGEPSDGENPYNDPMDTNTTPVNTTFPGLENPLILPPGDDDLNTFIPDPFDPDILSHEDEP